MMVESKRCIRRGGVELSPSCANSVVDFCCVVVVERELSAEVLGVVVVVEYLNWSASYLHGFCRLSSSSLAEIAKDDGLLWMKFKPVLRCKVV